MSGMTPAERIPQMTNDTGPQRPARTRARVQEARSNASLERELEWLSGRVIALEREKADVEAFAALAAHELVEPLIMAEAFAAMVGSRLEGVEHAESQRDLAALSRGAARVRLLVEGLLYDARGNSGAIRARPVDLDTVVSDCLTLLAPHIEARDASIEVPALPEVWGEEPSLSGVFSNLLINALKYSPRQGARIVVGVEEEETMWRFSVASEGPVIPEEDRKRIFMPFNRARGERRVRGAGLGLAICRRIVERHGGHIGVRPADGLAGGNTFYFTLPR
jgi:signal transduction histidine kinase